MQDLHTTAKDTLFRAILSLNTIEECYQFFEDVCTIKELEDMAQRMETAILLHQGESYLSISKKTNVSTATISRVNRCLHYGAGGYQKALENLRAAGEKEEENS